MAKMGRGSRSFMRFRELTEFVGEPRYMQDERKKTIMEYMHRFGYNDRAVYFAENMQTMSRDEMQAELADLSQKLQHAGADGVIEFHPTADGTSKSAHIHYWGKLTKEVEEIITDHIKQNRLSNKTYLNYTNEEMYRDRDHKIVNGKLLEFAYDRSDEENIKRETIREEQLNEDDIALKNAAQKESTYDDIIAYADEIMRQLDALDPDVPFEVPEPVEEIDMNEINSYIVELEIDLYE